MELQNILNLLFAFLFIYAIAAGKASKRHTTKYDFMNLHRKGLRVKRYSDPKDNDSDIGYDESEWLDDSVGRKEFGSQLN